MGVPAGSDLQFTEPPHEVVTVANPRKVIFRGEEVSLSYVTRELLGIDYNVRPTQYWIFNGRRLGAIYQETYENL